MRLSRTASLLFNIECSGRPAESKVARHSHLNGQVGTTPAAPSEGEDPLAGGEPFGRGEQQASCQPCYGIAGAAVRPAGIVLVESIGFIIIVIGPDGIVRYDVRHASPGSLSDQINSSATMFNVRFTMIIIGRRRFVHCDEERVLHQRNVTPNLVRGWTYGRTGLRSGARVWHSPQRVHVPPFALRRPSNARLAGACTFYPLRSGARARIMARKEKACS